MIDMSMSSLAIRIEQIEDRLAAIERAATCGTERPNEPSIDSPAQANVGEASAVSTEPTPGMVAAAKDAEILSAIGIYQDTCKLLQESRAEIERLKSKLSDAESKAVAATEHHHFYRNKVSDYVDNEVKLNAAITTLTRERAEARAEAEGQKLSLDGYRKMAAVVQERWYQLNDIHRKSKSNEECAELVRKCVTEWNELPITEYSALAAKLVEAESALATAREAAELLLNALVEAKKHVEFSVGKGTGCLGWIKVLELADTAILAAKAAGGTNTGERT